MKLLESGGNGAKLYATFENGLAYEVPAKNFLKELYENQIYGWRLKETFTLAYEVAAKYI